jgi:hypothetical protein
MNKKTIFRIIYVLSALFVVNFLFYLKVNSMLLAVIAVFLVPLAVRLFWRYD